MRLGKRGLLISAACCLCTALLVWCAHNPEPIPEEDTCGAVYDAPPKPIPCTVIVNTADWATVLSGETEDVDSGEGLCGDLIEPWQIQVGKYTIQSRRATTNDFSYSVLEVWDGQTLVYETEGFHLHLAREYATEDGEADAFFEPGTDVTGNGIPDLVVVDHSGYREYSLTYYIFELGDQFREVDEIHAEHGQIQFVRLDGEPNPVIKMQDGSYAHLFRWFPESPAPPIYLRYTDGRYTIATDLMEIPVPTEESLQSIAEDIRASYRELEESGELTGEWAENVPLWSAMLQLVYSGHEDHAQRLFDMAWSAGEENKERALEIFVEAVAESFYWRIVHPDPESELAWLDADEPADAATPANEELNADVSADDELRCLAE